MSFKIFSHKLIIRKHNKRYAGFCSKLSKVSTTSLTLPEKHVKHAPESENLRGSGLPQLPLLIIDIIQQYAVPVYSNTFTADPSNFEEIQFTIEVELFYETLLMLIRGETIKYSKQRAKALRKQEEDAQQEIPHLRNMLAQTGTESDVNKLLIAQEKLEKLREPKIQGAITRSRVRWYDEGEKCSKYFLVLRR